MKTVKAYKAFDKDLMYRNFQFEVGKEYTHEGKIKIGGNGFHAYSSLVDCFIGYPPNKKITRIAEVELLGDIVHGRNDTQICASKIKIVKELSWEEVLTLSNIGKNNKGIGNIGSYNVGSKNNGGYNQGSNNRGSCNIGSNNRGSFNFGNINSGNHNHGKSNVGDCNDGSFNRGHFNIGNFNNGHGNIGNENIGYLNIGNNNIGKFNIGNRNSGCFNTVSFYTLRSFNKEIAVEEYDKIYFPHFLFFNLIEWVEKKYATKEEKEEHKFILKCSDGFYRRLDYKEAFKKSWEKAAKYDREKIKDIPGFDRDIFYEISGIMVD